jgi:hypothetical protein
MLNNVELLLVGRERRELLSQKCSKSVMFHTQIPLLFKGIFVLNPSQRCIENFGHFSSFPKCSHYRKRSQNVSTQEFGLTQRTNASD